MFFVLKKSLVVFFSVMQAQVALNMAQTHK